MDPATIAMILGVLKAVEDLTNTAANVIAAAKANGDPTPEDVAAQMARSKAANDRLHALGAD